jgi:hypothetical protein
MTTTEKPRPLSPRLERALTTDSLEDLAELISSWPVAELEALLGDLDQTYRETRENIQRSYQIERDAVPEALRPLIEICYQKVQLRGDALHLVVSDVVAQALAAARQGEVVQ